MHFSFMQYFLYGIGYVAQIAILVISTFLFVKKKGSESALLFTGSLFIVLNSAISLFYMYASFRHLLSTASPLRDRIITASSSSLWVVGWICFVAGLLILVTRYLRQSR